MEALAVAGQVASIGSTIGGMAKPPPAVGGGGASSGVGPYQPPQAFGPMGAMLNQIIQQGALPNQGMPQAGATGPLRFDIRQYLPEWALRPPTPGGYQ